MFGDDTAFYGKWHMGSLKESGGPKNHGYAGKSESARPEVDGISAGTWSLPAQSTYSRAGEKAEKWTQKEEIGILYMKTAIAVARRLFPTNHSEKLIPMSTTIRKRLWQ